MRTLPHDGNVHSLYKSNQSSAEVSETTAVLQAAEGNAQIDKAVEILCSRTLLFILTYCPNVLTANMTSAVALLKALRALTQTTAAASARKQAERDDPSI